MSFMEQGYHLWVEDGPESEGGWKWFWKLYPLQLHLKELIGFENDRWLFVHQLQLQVAKRLFPWSERTILVRPKTLSYISDLLWLESHLNVFVFGPLKGCQTPIATDPFDIKLDFWQPTHHSPFECSHVCGRILIEKSHIWPRRYFIGNQQTTKFFFWKSEI